nr:unnamed protein product [Digitaria exilis]
MVPAPRPFSPPPPTKKLFLERTVHCFHDAELSATAVAADPEQDRDDGLLVAVAAANPARRVVSSDADFFDPRFA